MQAVPGLDTTTLELHLGYLPDVYQPDEAQGVLDRMVRLLEAVADSPDTPVGELDPAPAETEKDLLAQWGGY